MIGLSLQIGMTKRLIGTLPPRSQVLQVLDLLLCVFMGNLKLYVLQPWPDAKDKANQPFHVKKRPKSQLSPDEVLNNMSDIS